MVSSCNNSTRYNHKLRSIELNDDDMLVRRALLKSRSDINTTFTDKVLHDTLFEHFANGISPKVQIKSLDNTSIWHGWTLNVDRLLNSLKVCGVQRIVHDNKYNLWRYVAEKMFYIYKAMVDTLDENLWSAFEHAAPWQTVVSHIDRSDDMFYI
jgi:hypothetical protein